ncbi:LysE family translocator [Amylibacter sp. SFDW26]|uniref:LysE family translocator n=1 Tax=Amylibacter sp. SFDW26 TaxID=2652722 RepID=UPI001261692F|nr:LysE family translocator [Amylibacter sp. SFDW26]KAB7610472.1 LysE family translocator [Amylibacter sp. SFDW26]
METTTYLTFLVVVFAVLIAPGPSVTISMAHGAKFGAGRAAITGLGDISANLLQMIAAVAGLGAIISQSAILFSFIKWVGVAYLLYLGAMMILRAGRVKNQNISVPINPPSLFWHYRQGFIVAASSPKAILFYGALFPQFITPAYDLLPQFILLAATCVFLDWCIVISYGALAARAARTANGSPWIDRLGGAALITTAGFLAKTER